MNEKTLLLSLAALAGLSSCSFSPCLSRTFPATRAAAPAPEAEVGTPPGR